MVCPLDKTYILPSGRVSREGMKAEALSSRGPPNAEVFSGKNAE